MCILSELNTLAYRINTIKTLVYSNITSARRENKKIHYFKRFTNKLTIYTFNIVRVITFNLLLSSEIKNHTRCFHRRRTFLFKQIDIINVIPILIFIQAILLARRRHGDKSYFLGTRLPKIYHNVKSPKPVVRLLPLWKRSCYTKYGNLTVFLRPVYRLINRDFDNIFKASGYVFQYFFVQIF